MTEKQFPLSDDIINCLADDYGIEVTALKKLPIGADMDASVYKAEAPGKLSYFVKLKRGHKQDISLSILTQLQVAGIQHIIPPIKTNNGQLCNRINGFSITVYPFVDGHNGFSCHLSDTQWFGFGKALRQVHEFKMPPSLLSQLRRESYSDKWRQVVRSLYPYVEVQPHGDKIALMLSQFMRMHRETIRRLVDRSEELGRKVQKLSPEFVLCHSDIHGGNVMLSGDDEIYMVDWDDPIIAPKERDLMFIGGGVANVWNDPYEEQCFYNGYGKVEINKEVLAYYRHERIVEDVAEYGQSLLLSIDGDDREIMYKHFVAMFEPNGVIDIAFKTDESL